MGEVPQNMKHILTQSIILVLFFIELFNTINLNLAKSWFIFHFRRQSPGLPLLYVHELVSWCISQVYKTVRQSSISDLTWKSLLFSITTTTTTTTKIYFIYKNIFTVKFSRPTIKFYPFSTNIFIASFQVYFYIY